MNFCRYTNTFFQFSQQLATLSPPYSVKTLREKYIHDLLAGLRKITHEKHVIYM